MKFQEIADLDQAFKVTSNSEIDNFCIFTSITSTLRLPSAKSIRKLNLCLGTMSQQRANPILSVAF